MTNRSTSGNFEKGFTLIEALVGALILALGTLGMAQLLLSGIKMNVRAKDETELATIATQYMESLYQVSYSKLVVGGSLNPVGSCTPYCALDVFPESSVPANSAHHANATRYNVYWEISDGAGVIAGSPFKMIRVRVVSKRIKDAPSAPAREITLRAEVVNQFTI